MDHLFDNLFWFEDGELEPPLKEKGLQLLGNFNEFGHILLGVGSQFFPVVLSVG